MANKKISQLDAASAATNMVIPASDAAGTVTNKVTVQSILNLAKDAELRTFFSPWCTAECGRNTRK